jgi:hypothetical protein
MIKEHDSIVLTQDLPESGLERGDIGVVVHIHGRDEAYEVEFMTLTGDTVAIVTLKAKQIRAVDRRDVAHSRQMVAA